MGNSFGRRVLGTIGSTISVLASDTAHRKTLGLTVDWDTVDAVSGSDFTQEDGITVPIGTKMLRYGQLLTKITASGKFGPYDPAAADGRELQARGDAYVVNRTVVETDMNSDHPDVIDGGDIYLERVLQSGVGAHSLAAGPTLAEFEALFPLFTYARI